MNLCSQVYATINPNKKKNMMLSSTEPEESSSTYVNVKHLEGATKKDDTVVSAIHRNDVQYSTIPGTRNTHVCPYVSMNAHAISMAMQHFI